MGLFGFAVIGIIGWVVGSLARAMMTTDYRNDPVYKKNLQRLIDRNRQSADERHD
jgi:hypothetical protein